MELKKYKLGDLIDVTRGQSLSGEYYATEGKYIRLTCGNFDYNNNSFKENTSKDNLFFTGTIKPEFIMKKGDIITPLTEQAIGLLGSTAMIPESDKYIQSQDVAKIICKENKLDHDFAYYLISSKLVKEQLSAAAQQTKIRHTSPDKIKDCTVWIPDIVVQRRIASVLSALDRKISLNRSINEELERMAKEVYDYWFVQFDFPDEHGRPYKSSGGAMVYNPVLKREVPQGWGNGIIGNLFNSQAGYAFKSSEWQNEGQIVLTIKNIMEDGSISFSGSSYIKDDINEKLNKYKAINGNMIFAMSGNTIGKIGIISSDKPVLINQRVLIIKTKPTNLAFPYFIVKNKEIQNLVFQLGANSAQPNISEEEFRNIKIVLPSIKYIDMFNELCQPLFSKIIKNRIENSTLEKLRNTLLPLLMTGQVEVI